MIDHWDMNHIIGSTGSDYLFLYSVYISLLMIKFTSYVVIGT